METAVKTHKETLINKLNSAIAAAEAPEGVTYIVEDDGDNIVLIAAYGEEHEYFEEPFDALGEVVDGKEGLIVDAGNGVVHHCITYPVEQSEFEAAAAELIAEYDDLDDEDRADIDNLAGADGEISFGVDRDSDGDLIVVLGNPDGYVWGSASRETLASGIEAAASTL